MVRVNSLICISELSQPCVVSGLGSTDESDPVPEGTVPEQMIESRQANYNAKTVLITTIRQGNYNKTEYLGENYMACAYMRDGCLLVQVRELMGHDRAWSGDTIGGKTQWKTRKPYAERQAS